MRRSVPLLCATVLLLAACGRPAIQSGGATPAAAGRPAVSRPAPDPIPGATDRRADIFIAVLLRYLRADTSFPPGTFRVVFVLDHTEAGVGDPFRSENAPPPGPIISRQAAIAAALADVTRV